MTPLAHYTARALPAATRSSRFRRSQQHPARATRSRTVVSHGISDLAERSPTDGETSPNENGMSDQFVSESMADDAKWDGGRTRDPEF